MERRAVILCFVLLAAILVLSGCTGTPPPATPTPTPAPTTRAITTDPIIGTWSWTTFDRAKTIFYTFTYDGQYFASDSRNESSERGTWIKGNNSQYNVTVMGRISRVFVYQPATDSLVQADSPDIRFVPYVTPFPTPVPIVTKETIFQLGPLVIYK
jgi:hypothetical protein